MFSVFFINASLLILYITMSLTYKSTISRYGVNLLIQFAASSLFEVRNQFLRSLLFWRSGHEDKSLAIQFALSKSCEMSAESRSQRRGRGTGLRSPCPLRAEFHPTLSSSLSPFPTLLFPLKKENERLSDKTYRTSSAHRMHILFPC